MGAEVAADEDDDDEVPFARLASRCKFKVVGTIARWNRCLIAMSNSTFDNHRRSWSGANESYNQEDAKGAVAERQQAIAAARCPRFRSLMTFSEINSFIFLVNSRRNARGSDSSRKKSLEVMENGAARSLVIAASNSGSTMLEAR